MHRFLVFHYFLFRMRMANVVYEVKWRTLIPRPFSCIISFGHLNHFCLLLIPKKIVEVNKVFFELKFF